MIKQFILTSIAILTMVLISNGQTQKITVSGNVVDNRGNPVHLAHITFTDLDTTGGNTAATDTLLTKADGTYSKQITLNSTARMLFYIVIMDGHTTKTGFKFQLSPTMNLGTTTLEIASATDSLEISGIVHDNKNNEPIADAQVVMSVISTIVSLPDTLYTNANGEFSHTIAGTTEGIFSTEPKVYYDVSKINFTEIKDSLVITSKVIDLGTITLKNTTDIKHKHSPILEIENQPYNVTIYTLNGQKVFQGTKEAFSRYKNLINLPTQYYILEKKFKGITISNLEYIDKK